MGRKAKYLTESAKKKAKREKRTVGLQKSIYLGKAFSAWTDAKRTTEASSDQVFATILLERYYNHYVTISPSCRVRGLRNHGRGIRRV